MTRKLSRSELIVLNRKRQIRNQFILIGVSLFVMIMLFSVMFSIKGVASTENQEYYKYFKTVEITDGLTIEDLAEEYANPAMISQKEYAMEVRFINNLDSSENPNSGKYIIIPYYDTIHS